MQTSEDIALEGIFADEGGYAERASEPGGAVNMGISFLVFEGFCTLHGNAHPTFEDLKGMTKIMATAIYRMQFMTPLHFDDLPAGVDYAMLNTCVNLGLVGGIKCVQATVLGFEGKAVDGHMGAATMAAMLQFSSKWLPDAINDAWLSAKKMNPNWAKFGPGWTNRYHAVRGRLATLTGITNANDPSKSG